MTVMIKRTAVAMVCVSAEADIGHHHKARESAFEERNCALHYTLGIKGAGTSGILGSFSLTKEQDAADPLFRDRFHSAQKLVYTKPILSRHRVNRLTPFLSFDKKERPDKLRCRRERLIKKMPEGGRSSQPT
jgi:hypothetical protein